MARSGQVRSAILVGWAQPPRAAGMAYPRHSSSCHGEIDARELANGRRYDVGTGTRTGANGRDLQDEEGSRARPREARAHARRWMGAQFRLPAPQSAYGRVVEV